MRDDDSRTIGNAAVGSLLLNVGVAVLGAVLLAMSGDFVANLDHPIQFVGLATGLLSVVLFFVWVSRAHARAVRASPELKSDGFGPVVGFFVPFVNFVHPYKVVGGMWRVLTRSSPMPVLVWWVGSNGLLAAFYVAARLVDPGDRIYVQVGSKILTAVLCLATAYIVWSIERGATRVAPTGASAPAAEP